MQVTETLSEGLRREFKITIPAKDMDDKLLARLAELKDQVQIRGFRPGKVPVAHLRRIYGRSAMAEVIEKTVMESSRKVIDERKEKPAMQPQFTLPEDETEAAEVLAGKSDLEFSIKYEVLPDFALGDFATIEIERLMAEPGADEIDDRLDKIYKANAVYEAKTGAAVAGDQMTIDFVGKIDDEPFEGGTGEGIDIVLGSGDFIPGFEDQLIGAEADSERVVEVTFPDNYSTRQLAGKAATFDVSVKAVSAPKDAVPDDDFAQTLGLESMEKLREIIRGQVQSEYDAASRQKVKRMLLDALDEMHKFELPPTMVDDEFKNIWREVESDLERSGNSFEDEDTTEEKAREEYRGIAERRVRLGLVLAEIGDKNGIKVNDDEVQRAIIEQARSFPGREQQVWEFYQKNPEAVASVRAPIFEEKVIDFLLELVKVNDKTVSKDELFADMESDDGHHHHDHDH